MVNELSLFPMITLRLGTRVKWITLFRVACKSAVGVLQLLSPKIFALHPFGSLVGLWRALFELKVLVTLGVFGKCE
jgi:hypothetical protein